MRLRVLSLALCALALSWTAPVARAGNSKPIQLSLFTPIQIFSEKESIGGLRVNLI
jgi:hypothetical protein